jgi:pimeloyl-ACP methyl ester carboxylesterase
MKQSVVLLHGLMTKSYIMRYLAKKFNKAGYDVHLFDYNSIRYSEQTLAKLHALLQSLGNKPVSLVGHSMGGLVIRNYIDHYQKDTTLQSIQSVVTIATPHYQSLCAHNLANSFFRKHLGSAGESGLTCDIAPWQGNIPMGCIAGLNKSLLSANFFAIKHRHTGDYDGTVFLREAILENCHDFVTLKGSHTGMLFQANVARQCLHFLEKQQFDKETT